MKENIPISIIPNVFDGKWDISLKNNKNNNYRSDTLSIYIHYPFCRQKCKFCQIETIKHESEVVSAYLSSLKKEIILHGEILREHNVNCIHFGGGTPSLMEARDIESIINVIDKYTDINKAELLFEVHPAFISDSFLSCLSNVNNCTVNFGVQSFDDTISFSMNRGCTGGSVIKGIERIQSKVGAIGIDIICDLPNSNQKTLDEDIRIIKGLDPDHISQYPFMLHNTPLSRNVEFLNNFRSPSINEKISINDSCAQMLRDLGYQRYSIYHYTKKNMHTHRYGRNQINGGRWIGFGAKAYSYLDNKVYINSEINEYIKGNYVYRKKAMKHTECAVWNLAYAFRKVPIDKEEICEKYGAAISPYMDKIICKLERDGFIESSSNLELNWMGIINIHDVEKIIKDSIVIENTNI